MNTITVNRAVMRKHIEALTNLHPDDLTQPTEIMEVILWMESLMGRSKDDELAYVLLDGSDPWHMTVWGPFSLKDAQSCHCQQDPEVYSSMSMALLTMPDKNQFDPNLRS